MSRNPHAGPRRQRGVTLVIVLMLLLIVTMLGLAAMRGTVMQERMSGNTLSRSVAFQLAEGALREVEANLTETGRPVVPGAGCSVGVCAMPAAGAASTWEAANFWTSGSGYATSALQEGGHQLRYVVEDMGDGLGESAGCVTGVDMMAPTCTEAGTPIRHYRITVFSRTANGAEVLLQSTFQLP